MILNKHEFSQIQNMKLMQTLLKMCKILVNIHDKIWGHNNTIIKSQTHLKTKQDKAYKIS